MNTNRRGIAERIGSWSAAHRKTAILGWIAFVVAALMVGGSIGTEELTNGEATPGEAGEAEQALVDSGLAPASEQVLIESEELTVADKPFRATIEDVTAGLEQIDVVRRLRSPLEDGGAVSADGHAALVQFEIKGDPDTAADRLDPITESVTASAERHPELRVEQFGGASADEAVNEVLADDLRKAETLSLPVTLIILIVAFGSLVAAGVPLLLGISAVMATFGLVALPSQLFPVEQSIASVILLIGLAVGVDYALFYLRREREERRAGRSPTEALSIASATSGRAVLVSGLTVITAMAGMLLSGDSKFISFGIGTMLVVGVAMTASVTVLPAVVSALGDRVEKGRVPFAARIRERRSNRGGIWTAIVDRVLRRPALSVVLAGGALVALAVPALSMNLEVGGVDTLPREIPVVQTYDRIQAAFPGENIPAIAVVEASDVRGGEVGAAIETLVSESAGAEGVVGPVDVTYSRDGTAASITIPIAGEGSNEQSEQALANVREQLIPAAFGGVDGAEVNVSGQTAGSVDFKEKMRERLPLVFAFVLGLAFVLMLVTFRSIVIPLKAIALNLLSVGAAYGVLVLVFQNGLGSDLLGFETPGLIIAWIPLFLFVVLFGLSMDYHVFILSRIREAVDSGLDTEDAVRHGIRSTAGTVTSAAFVMVAVFAIFATLSLIEMKQLGVGLAVAVLIDATIVRAVLLPASMTLLGRWNWYLPSSLRWLPAVKHEAGVAPTHS